MRLVRLLAIVILLFPEVLGACSCGRIGEVEEETHDAESVFTGRVVKVEDRFSWFDKAAFWVRSTYARVTAQYKEPELKPREWGFTVTLEVSEWWKGAGKKRVALVTGRGGGDCGLPFDLDDIWSTQIARMGTGTTSTSAAEPL